MLDYLDPRIGNTFLDSNVLDTDGPEAAAAAKILELYEQPVHDFRLLLTSSVKKEIGHPHTPPCKQRRAKDFVYSEEPVDQTANELARHGEVRALIQGNSKPGRHDSDAFHLVEAQKYGGRHFITNDGRLLKKAGEIWRELQLKVVKPREWLAAYNAHARERSPGNLQRLSTWPL